MSLIFQKKVRGAIPFLTSDASFTGKKISMMKENYNFRSWYIIFVLLSQMQGVSMS